MRITAVVALGREGIIDVEREAQLGGPSTRKASRSCEATSAACSARSAHSACVPSSPSSRATARSTATAPSSSELFAVLSGARGASHRPRHRRYGQRQPARRAPGHRWRLREDRGVLRSVRALVGYPGGRASCCRRRTCQHLVLRGDVAERHRRGPLSPLRGPGRGRGIELLTGVPAGERDAVRALPGSERLRARRASSHRDRRALAASRKPRHHESVPEVAASTPELADASTFACVDPHETTSSAGCVPSSTRSAAYVPAATARHSGPPRRQRGAAARVARAFGTRSRRPSRASRSSAIQTPEPGAQGGDRAAHGRAGRFDSSSDRGPTRSSRSS